MSFFSKDGISQTAASSLANENAQVARNIDMELERFVPTTTVLHRGDKSYTQQEANIDVQRINDLLVEKARRYRFSAWLREAVTQKEAKMASIQSRMFLDSGIVPPNQPSTQPDVDQQWAINQFNIKEMSEYLALTAEASVYGKALHENGLFRQWQKKANAPHLQEVRSDLVETTVRMISEIDALNQRFFAHHRTVNQQVNRYKARIQKAVTNRNLEIAAENEMATATYQGEYKSYRLAVDAKKQAFEKQKMEDLKAAAALKIAIPNEFQELLGPPAE